jgi:hypothetical protein
MLRAPSTLVIIVVLANFVPRSVRLVTFPPWYRSALEGTHTNMARLHGDAAMTGVLNDLLLFSCLAAFVTGVVIAAATILI